MVRLSNPLARATRCGVAGVLALALGACAASAPAAAPQASERSAPAATAAGIPAHPRELTYPPLTFELQPGSSYRHELAGGVPVYVAEDHQLPLATVSVIVRVGAFLDARDRPGVAGLAGQMLRRGGTARLSAQEFDQRADFLAANISAMAGDTSGRSSVNCLTQNLDACLDLWFEMLREPGMEAARLAVEKANLREALQQRNDDPQDILQREWQWLLRGRDHFTSAFLTAAQLDAIEREELLAFHRRWWHPANMVFAVSGDVDTEDILRRIETRIAGWQGGERAPWPPPPPAHAPPVGLFHVEKDVPQGAVLIGALTKQRDGWDDPDVFPLDVMNEILGGSGFTSRITKRIRSDEGLAYSAGSGLDVGLFWPGDFRIAYQSKSPTVAYAARIALDEVQRIRQEPVSEEELRTAKNALIDSFPRRFQTPALVVGTYAMDAYVDRPHAYWQQYRERVRAVTAADVQRVAQEYLHPDRMAFLVVGKWDEIAAGDPQGRAKMEQFFEGRVTHLPLRDPLTLEPLAP